MNLPELRSEIEKIDAEIVRLLNRRTQISIEVGRTKRATNGEVFVPAREEELLRTLSERNRQAGGPLPDADLRAIYTEILSRSRAQQQPLVVGYVGAEAPSGFLAARLRFGSGESYTAFADEAALWQALQGGAIDAAIAAATSVSPLPAGVRACGDLPAASDLAYRLLIADTSPLRP